MKFSIAPVYRNRVINYGQHTINLRLDPTLRYPK